MAEQSKLHYSVMLNEVLSFVPRKIKDNFVFCDMTLGRGGHSKNIIKQIDSDSLNFYGFDRDQEAIDYVKELFSNLELKGNLNLVKSKFSDACDYLNSINCNGIDLCLFDIGVSSPQFDDPKRGFSYRFDAKLDMRMDQSQKLTAYDVINKYSQKELSHIIFEYGEEKYGNSIAKNIVMQRQIKPIETTFELVDIIKSSMPSKELHKQGHPAKKTFMAIRYEVNKEHDELVTGLKKAIEHLNPQGILMVITFNSREDYYVKNIMKQYSTEEVTSKYLPPSTKKIEYQLLTRKPLVPTEKEIEENPRSKPSKLRVIQKIV